MPPARRHSITRGWQLSHPEFFTANGFIDRGISGQYWLNFAGAVGFGAFGIVAYSNTSFFGGPNHKADQAADAALASGLLGGIGFIIDSSNGSMWDHNPNKVMLDLEH